MGKKKKTMTFLCLSGNFKFHFSSSDSETVNMIMLQMSYRISDRAVCSLHLQMSMSLCGVLIIQSLCDSNGFFKLRTNIHILLEAHKYNLYFEFDGPIFTASWFCCFSHCVFKGYYFAYSESILWFVSVTLVKWLRQI